MTKKMISSFLFGISFFLFAILIPHNAAAKTVIADTAHALSTDESDQIIEQCDTIYDHYNTSVYITITKSWAIRMIISNIWIRSVMTRMLQKT